MEEQQSKPVVAADQAQDVNTLLSAYKTMLDEWERSHGEELGNDYRTVLLVLLGAEGYIAYTASFTNWLVVLVVGGISAFGLMLMRHQDTLTKANAAISTDIAQVCLELEVRLARMGVFSKGFMSDLFYNHALKFRLAPVSLTYPRLFAVTFIVIPVALILATLLTAIPLTHPFIHPLVGQ